MKHLTLALIMILICLNSPGQEIKSCGTLPMDSAMFWSQPWVGNNQYLLDLLDSLGYGQTSPIPKSLGDPIQGGFDSQATYWVPVKAWVYNDDTGDGGITPTQVEANIRFLNEHFAGKVNEFSQPHSHSMIQFYLVCDITYQNSSSYTLNPSSNARIQMWSSNYVAGAINIHFIQSSEDYGGKARLPTGSLSFSCSIVTNQPDYRFVIAHEIGHNLGLQHTHDTRGNQDNGAASNCKQEAVSRAKLQGFGCTGYIANIKKCEINGDGYCDTQADPNLLGLVEFDLNVPHYTGTGTDNWGDSWTPDIFNIMSYSSRITRERFSPMQIGTMLEWVLGIQAWGEYTPLNYQNQFIDIYEPDNTLLSASSMEINSTQHRGLHAVHTGHSNTFTVDFCDEDWIRIEIPSNSTQKINISTEAVPNRPQVNTEIFLFDEDGTTLLASNDDKEVGDIYSEISEFELSSGTYWIQVVSVGNTSGEYYLNVERCAEECCFQPLIGTTTVIDGVTGPFNLGAVEQVYTDYLGNSLNVSSLLAFNSNLPLGFGGAGFPVPSSELDAIICNEAQIQISSGAIMIIGDNPSNRTAQVTFQEGSKLIVNPYAELIVREGSKLIIESGAELRLNGGQVRVFDGGEIIIKEGGLLIYEDGVVLQLNGNDAQLALGGHTHIGDNATFRFFWQGSESGYVRLLKEGHWGQRFSAGTNARIRLQGTGKDDLILHMEESADLWEYAPGESIPGHSFTSTYFDRVTLQNGKVVMEDDARIILQRHGRLYSIYVEAFNASPPRGIQALGLCDIVGSDFLGIPIDAPLHWFDLGALLVKSSNFYNSGIVVKGRYFTINDCFFWKSNVSSEGATLLSSVFFSGFEDCRLYHNSISELRVSSSFFYNSDHGLTKNQGRLTLRCNTFNNISSDAVIGSDKTVINMSTLHGGGYNYFENNGTNIYLNFAAGLLLDLGYNELYAGDFMNIEGKLMHPINQPCPYIGASFNKWTAWGAAPDPAFPNPAQFDVKVMSSNNGVPTILCNVPFHFSPVSDRVACGTFDDPGSYPEPKSGSQKQGDALAYPSITTPNYFEDTPLDQALNLTLATTTMVDSLLGNNLTAAGMYHELLLAEIAYGDNDSLMQAVENTRWSALHGYKALIEYMLVDSTLTAEANAQSWEMATQTYVNTLMYMTDSVNTPENYKHQFDLELMKANLFRGLGKHATAYAIIANMDYCTHDAPEAALIASLMESIAYDIYALQTGPQLYLLEGGSLTLDSAMVADILNSIPIDTSTFGSYIVDPNYVWFSYCNETYANKRGNFSGQELAFHLHPNPTSASLFVTFPNAYLNSTEPFEFRLFDLQGRPVVSKQVRPGQWIELPPLPQSLYLAGVYHNGQMLWMERLSVIK